MRGARGRPARCRREATNPARLIGLAPRAGREGLAKRARPRCRRTGAAGPSAGQMPAPAPAKRPAWPARVHTGPRAPPPPLIRGTRPEEASRQRRAGRRAGPRLTEGLAPCQGSWWLPPERLELAGRRCMPRGRGGVIPRRVCACAAARERGSEPVGTYVALPSAAGRVKVCHPQPTRRRGNFPRAAGARDAPKGLRECPGSHRGAAHASGWAPAGPLRSSARLVPRARCARSGPLRSAAPLLQRQPKEARRCTTAAPRAAQETLEASQPAQQRLPA